MVGTTDEPLVEPEDEAMLGGGEMLVIAKVGLVSPESPNTNNGVYKLFFFFQERCR